MAGSLANVSILIVDDSPHLRRLIITMLRSFGAQVMYEAKNYQQAVEFIDRKPVDIALVDWMLADPLGNGNDLINYIRRSMVDEVAFMPIIMITGHTEKENIENARDIGVTEFLAKPFTAKNLYARISALIDAPRPFVRTRAYFGPDRRRKLQPITSEGERRFRPPSREK